MAENNISNGSTAAGFQFSALGALIMFLLYLAQVTGTAQFIFAPGVTLTIAMVAALGALLFYYGGKSDNTI